ncbi:MAG: N-6 DNA methylase [Nanoarchaeota archaeon]
MVKKKANGQYFTPKLITDFMVELIENKNNPSIFESCAGEGAFLKSLEEKGFTNITAFEIDNKLENKSNVKIEYKDTLTNIPNKKFKTIIGNPPYVRWKNIPESTREKLKLSSFWKDKINGLNDLLYLFILMSIDLLEENGELIFITPTFWTSTLHSKKIRQKMQEEGEITHLINFDEMKLFSGVSSNLLVFRFVKRKENKSMKVINIKNKGNLTNEIIQKIKELLLLLEKKDEIKQDFFQAFNHKQFTDFEDWNALPPSIESKIKNIEKSSNSKLGSFCEICNGMVSGLDEAFKVENVEEFSQKEKQLFIKVVKAKDLNKFFNDSFTNYIFLNDKNITKKELNSYPKIKEKLQRFRDGLIKRYCYQKDIPYWEWVFLRNKSHIEKSNKKIICPCKERFDSRNYVRFALIEGDYYVTQDATAIIPNKNVKEDIKYFLALLNSELIFQWLKYKGLNRGGSIGVFRKTTFFYTNKINKLAGQK